MMRLVLTSVPPACSTHEAGESCQQRIISLEGNVSNMNVYNLNTLGVQGMVYKDGTKLASYSDNINVYVDTIALFRTG